jgi:hypothetical protein
MLHLTNVRSNGYFKPLKNTPFDDSGFFSILGETITTPYTYAAET